MSQNDLVKVTVIHGSVNTWKDGVYVKGDSFVTTREEANRIDPPFVTIATLQTNTPVIEDPKETSAPIAPAIVTAQVVSEPVKEAPATIPIEEAPTKTVAAAWGASKKKTATV
jgi:hypothetical protein